MLMNIIEWIAKIRDYQSIFDLRKGCLGYVMNIYIML